MSTFNLFSNNNGIGDGMTKKDKDKEKKDKKEKKDREKSEKKLKREPSKPTMFPRFFSSKSNNSGNNNNIQQSPAINSTAMNHSQSYEEMSITNSASNSNTDLSESSTNNTNINNPTTSTTTNSESYPIQNDNNNNINNNGDLNYNNNNTNNNNTNNNNNNNNVSYSLSGITSVGGGRLNHVATITNGTVSATYMNNTYKLQSTITESDNSIDSVNQTPQSSISTSSSSSSLRSSSANSLNQRSSSFSSQQSNTFAIPFTKLTQSTDMPTNNNNNNKNVILNSSNDSSNNNSSSSNNNSNRSTLKKSSNKIKKIYNSLRFTLRGGEKSSSHPYQSSGVNDLSSSSGSIGHMTKSSSQFDFAVPLPLFDQQFPSIIQFINSQNSSSSSNNNNSNDNLYFGVPLAHLSKRQDNGTGLPILVEKCISFLEGYVNVEALFKNKFDMQKVQSLKHQFDTVGDANFFYPEHQDPNDVAALLIEFISSLPDELLNIELYQAVISHTNALKSEYGGYWDIQYMVSKLQREARETVQRLLAFLKQLVSHSPSPQTCLDQLSALFTPLLVNHKSHLILQPATNILIERFEDLFIDNDNRPTTLASEFIMLQIEKVLIPSNNLRIVNDQKSSLEVTGWETGTLYVTNYRLMWIKTEDDSGHYLLPEDYDRNKQEMHIKPYQIEIVLTSSIKWEHVGKSSSSSSSSSKSSKSNKIQSFIYLLYCKDMRFQYFAFPDDFNMDRFNLILAYYMNPVSDFGRFFAFVNQEILTTEENQEGWEIYCPTKEAARQKIDLTKEWKIFNFTNKESISPKRVVLPNRVGEELLQSYAKKKIPVFSWIHPYRRSMLFRPSVQSGAPPPSIGGSLTSSGGISMSTTNASVQSLQGSTQGVSSLGGSLSSSTEEGSLQQSPHKKRSALDKTFSPRTLNKSLSSKNKKDISFTKLPTSTTILTDSVDIMLYQQFVNSDNVGSSNNNGGGSPSLLSQSGNNSPVFGSAQSGNSSSMHTPPSPGGKRRVEASIVFTNKLDINFVSVYDQFKLNSNIVFLGVAPREEVEQHWFELYRSINMFDGSSEAWRSIEESGWVESVRQLIEGSARISTILEEGTSVLVKPSIESNLHTFDVARLTSIVQVMLDPYYRTLNGFMTLIEKEWVQYNFPFLNNQSQANGSGGSGNSSSPNTTPSLSGSISGSGSSSIDQQDVLAPCALCQQQQTLVVPASHLPDDRTRGVVHRQQPHS
ncbi:hypothetical protein PPL_07407 [Heterostelium album PN500]|uniref:Uncharacterized protein n=1 Tax=Heterostelium pallidum (strain ATCC 26659 / Pp 5 / PN500) TaxID=670386 RepID=D3BFV6_HETP5|nr:hypothetical protein PPL_07407 [Heterostelium album PN500]EFA79716.1 hypothetical protein PPL_07407 [Heterostelium album PN500]|eukprot:XP_020431837.1 hypothetical protein PPL_07407 [Heterostelium album PN500]